MKATHLLQIMEFLPLIPRIQNTVTPEMGCLVREVFQNAFQSETVTWRLSINLSKSCHQNPDLRQIAAQIQAEIIEHKETLDDLEYAEIQIMKSQGYHLCRNQTMMSNERAMEIIRLKRHPLYIDLHPNIIEKYPLLQSDDLLPPMHECATDFRLDKRDRTRMKKRLCKSKDSLLDERPLSKITSRFCRFDTIAEQNSKKLASKTRSIMLRKATHRRSIIKSEIVKTVLVAEPQEVFFHNFEYNKMYKKIVLIKNVSNSTVRYKIERRSPDSKFTILFDTAAVGTTKIAPGMHVKLTVLFLCDVIKDPEEFLIINVLSGKTVCVKMYGYRDTPILRALTPLYQVEIENNSSSFLSIDEEEGERDIHEKQRTRTLGNIEEYGKGEVAIGCNVNLGAYLECGKCFAGERILVLSRFINDGGNGRFFIMSEIDWCTMNIDDIMDCNMILIPPFAMWPIYFTLRSGECIEIHTYFYPESYGMKVDKLYILCDNHAIHPVELIGDGILYDPKFVHFSDNMEKTVFPVNENEPFANYYINMGDVASGETVENAVFVTNTSGLEMYYRWEKHSAKYSSSSPKSSWAHLPIENLDVQPAKGSLNSNFITSFRIVAQSKALQPREYLAILRLYIEDIPLAAIPKDFDSRITECFVKRRNCPITVDILVADIEVWVHCTPGEISLHPVIIEKIQGETRCLDEAEEQNGVIHNHFSSSSMTAMQSLSRESCVMSDNPSICGMARVQCNEYYKGTKNSENLWHASLGMMQNLDVDTAALAIPRLEFQHQIDNIAVLIPDRPLYVGIEQAYTLTLRNLICKPLLYAWGQPLNTNGCRMRVNFNPEKGLIPPADTAVIEVICLPMDTGILDNFYIPCFIGGRQDPIILGIECTISTLYVTFIFLPSSNVNLSPCVDSVRIEWHKHGQTSALNLNNLKMNLNSRIDEEQELKNIDLDAGQVVTTTAVGPTSEEAENLSLVHFSETPSMAKQKSNKLKQNKGQNKSVEKSKLKDNATAEPELERVKPPELRSWECLLQGIVWTDDRSDEFISLTKPQAIVPFHRTIVPPITQTLAIEFIDLPLRTVEKRTFVIRNETPAESTFLITLNQFGPIEIVKELNPKSTIDVTYANVMGHKSENYWEEIKRPGQGIVLVIEPTKGTLTSYETIPIDIYVYADTWGVYVAEITVAIVGLPDYVIGVCTEVVGSPIAYPICRNGLHEIPTLRFGTLNFGTKSITRKIAIENTSGVMLTVNWCSYLIDPSPVTKNSIPFNIVLQMFTPFTNKIANMAYTGLTNAHNLQKISTADSTTEKSWQSMMDSDEWNSVNCSTIVEMHSPLSNCYQGETEDQSFQNSTFNPTWRGCCSESFVPSARMPPRNKECKARNSIETDNLDDKHVEYTTESEMKSISLSEETINKKTDLELTLTPYYGEPDYSVFTVSPAEIIIPTEGKKLIEITLNIAKDKLRMENCKNEIFGRLMGFIRVAPMHKYKADCYSRNDGTLLTPTEIQLQATITEPTLLHEFAESDRLFKIFASGIFTYFGKRIKLRRKYVFRNSERKAMFVKVQSAKPFQVLSLSTLKSKINPSESNGIFVPPDQCVENLLIFNERLNRLIMQVDVLCTVDASWIDQAMEMCRYQNAEDSYADIKKSLIICHAESCDQVVPLCLRIYLPLLKLSTHEMKFETLYIGNSKQIILLIENLSNEKQILNIRAKRNNQDFAIVPNQGILTHGNSTLEVVVTFTASELDKSLEVLQITTALPDYIEECIIAGYGSWDEKFNDISK